METLDKVMQFEATGFSALNNVKAIQIKLEEAYQAHYAACQRQINYVGKGVHWATALFNHLMNKNQPVYSQKNTNPDFYFNVDKPETVELLQQLAEQLNCFRFVYIEIKIRICVLLGVNWL